jgi:hypothetical protein
MAWCSMENFALLLQPFLLQRDSCVPGKHRIIETIGSTVSKGLGVESSDSPLRM